MYTDDYMYVVTTQKWKTALLLLYRDLPSSLFLRVTINPSTFLGGGWQFIRKVQKMQNPTNIKIRNSSRKTQWFWCYSNGMYVVYSNIFPEIHIPILNLYWCRSITGTAKSLAPPHRWLPNATRPAAQRSGAEKNGTGAAWWNDSAARRRKTWCRAATRRAKKI